MAYTKFPLYPYQPSYNNWIQVWDGGYTPGGQLNPGAPQIGSLPPGLLQNGSVYSFASLLGWPTHLPFNQSRTLFLSSTDANWSDHGSVALIYQNYWGYYIKTEFAFGDWDATTGTLIGTSINNFGTPTDVDFVSCPKFYYPNRLIDLQVEYFSDTLPTAPLNIDFGNEGMAEFQIQDSTRFGNSNFSLEILTDFPGTTPNYSTQYTILTSSYPRFVFENNQMASVIGPMTQSFFFGNDINTAFLNTSGAPAPTASSILWLGTEDFVIDGPLNANSFTNLPFLGAPLNILVDIGNQRRNPDYDPEDPTAGPYNLANLLLSLVQNGITN